MRLSSSFFSFRLSILISYPLSSPAPTCSADVYSLMGLTFLTLANAEGEKAQIKSYFEHSLSSYTRTRESILLRLQSSVQAALPEQEKQAGEEVCCAHYDCVIDMVHICAVSLSCLRCRRYCWPTRCSVHACTRRGVCQGTRTRVCVCECVNARPKDRVPSISSDVCHRAGVSADSSRLTSRI